MTCKYLLINGEYFCRISPFSRIICRNNLFVKAHCPIFRSWIKQLKNLMVINCVKKINQKICWEKRFGDLSGDFERYWLRHQGMNWLKPARGCISAAMGNVPQDSDWGATIRGSALLGSYKLQECEYNSQRGAQKRGHMGKKTFDVDIYQTDHDNGL